MTAKKKSKKKASKKSKATKAFRPKRTRVKAKRAKRTSLRLKIERPTPATQSGDLQGVSRRERADSESVDELLEEGNTFEAGVVGGVEHADDADESEVHTHEVPEDDVPEEYLDKD